MIETLSRSLEGTPGRARIKLREVISAGPVSMAQRQQGHQKLARLVADLLPQSATLTPQDRMLLGRGIVAARLTSYYSRGWTMSRTYLARMWSNW
jgi:hypothetical protein